jgi:predicted dinucleotide-binding enzyme
VKKIVVVGTGRTGGAFATAFAERTSHTVAIRGSHPSSATAAALSRQLGARVAGEKILLAVDVVFIATPPAALDDVAAALKGYAGIIVSAMVPGARLRAEARRRYKRDRATCAPRPEGARRHCVPSISSALIREPASVDSCSRFGSQQPALLYRLGR